MRFRTLALTVVVFAVAMAYLESACVVYLQRALSISPDQLFPLRGPEAVGDLAAIEVGRELATLAMLAALGCLAGSRWLDRLAWTAVAFGAWDIAYYGWLWVFVGWPHSPGTWDLLFLIPVPWAGPVWAPVAVSLALIGFGLAAAYASRLGRPVQADSKRFATGLAGGLLVVLSFTLDAPGLMSGRMPGWYPWPVFAAGMALASWAAWTALRAGAADSREARSRPS
ncbi:MAG: hypothetical protein ABSE70_00830 [Candidatus Limnocylindrales bacterium]